MKSRPPANRNLFVVVFVAFAAVVVFVFVLLSVYFDRTQNLRLPCICVSVSESVSVCAVCTKLLHFAWKIFCFTTHNFQWGFLVFAMGMRRSGKVGKGWGISFVGTLGNVSLMQSTKNITKMCGAYKFVVCCSEKKQKELDEMKDTL